MRIPFFQSQSPHIRGKKYRGVIETLLAWLLFSCIPIIVKLEIKTTPPLTWYFIQFLTMFLIFLPFCLKKGIGFFIPSSWLMVIGRGVIAVAGYYAFILSGLLSSVTDNAILFNTEPLWVPLLLYIFARQKIGLNKAGDIFVGFLGVIIIYYTPGLVEQHINIGGILGLLGGLTMAIVLVMTAPMVKKEPPLRIGFYHALIAVCFSGGLAICCMEPITLSVLITAVISGFLFAIALYLFIDSYYYTESHILAYLSYSLVIFSIIFELIIWREYPLFQEIIGFLLIMISGMKIINKSPHLDEDRYFI